jgi:DNA-3-methyladenine glycosylase II
MKIVTNENLSQIALTLAERDPDLSGVIHRIGLPPLWARRPGFATLVHIILEQQVSLASAKSAFNRLQATISSVTPGRFLTLDDTMLKAIGFSRQKMGYCRLLAQALIDRKLDLKKLNKLQDEDVRLELKKLKGVGDWTADIYLLMAMRRPDIWPKGDLALLIAMQKLKSLSTKPTQDHFDEIGESWRPYRSIAARMLWHFYLNGRYLDGRQS